MRSSTLTNVLAGRIDVRIDRRTPDGGLSHVAAGRLVGGDRAGNSLDIRTGHGAVRTVRLSGAHVVAYTPIKEAR